MCLEMELCCQGWEADFHLMPFEFWSCVKVLPSQNAFRTIAGSISFPPSWWHRGASFYQKVDQWTLKMRKARDQSCSLAGSAAAMLSTSLQPNSWLQFSLVVGVWLRELKMPHFSSSKNKQTKTICLQVSSTSGLWCQRVSWRTRLGMHHPPHQRWERVILWVPVPGRFIGPTP